MSSLNQLLAERRRGSEAPLAHTCHTAEPHAASLIVTKAAGESWVFPWLHLVNAELMKRDEREELRLTFVSHEVKLVGTNLNAIRDLVAKVQLARVWPVPAKYAGGIDPAPLIESIHVTANQSLGPTGHTAA